MAALVVGGKAAVFMVLIVPPIVSLPERNPATRASTTGNSHSHAGHAYAGGVKSTNRSSLSLGYRQPEMSAIVRRKALFPGLHFRFACIVAGPEQRFMAGKPIAEAVAAAAVAGAADHALLRGPFQPARQGRAVRRVAVAAPLFEDFLLAELLHGAV